MREFEMKVADQEINSSINFIIYYDIGNGCHGNEHQFHHWSLWMLMIMVIKSPKKKNHTRHLLREWERFRVSTTKNRFGIQCSKLENTRKNTIFWIRLSLNGFVRIRIVILATKQLLKKKCLLVGSNVFVILRMSIFSQIFRWIFCESSSSERWELK